MPHKSFWSKIYNSNPGGYSIRRMQKVIEVEGTLSLQEGTWISIDSPNYMVWQLSIVHIVLAVPLVVPRVPAHCSHWALVVDNFAQLRREPNSHPPTIIATFLQLSLVRLIQQGIKQLWITFTDPSQVLSIITRSLQRLPKERQVPLIIIDPNHQGISTVSSRAGNWDDPGVSTRTNENLIFCFYSGTNIVKVEYETRKVFIKFILNTISETISLYSKMLLRWTEGLEFHQH